MPPSVLQDVPFRDAIRHVSGCKTVHLANQNDPFRDSFSPEKAHFPGHFPQKARPIHCTARPARPASRTMPRRYGCTPILAIFAPAGLSAGNMRNMEPFAPPNLTLLHRQNVKRHASATTSATCPCTIALPPGGAHSCPPAGQPDSAGTPPMRFLFIKKLNYTAESLHPKGFLYKFALVRRKGRSARPRHDEHILHILLMTYDKPRDN